MELVTIQTEIFKHLNASDIKVRLFDEFEPKIQLDLAKKYSTNGYITDTDPLESVLLSQHYLHSYQRGLLQAVTLVIQLFKNYKIEFRLYDLSFAIHAPHRICLVWMIKNVECAFEIIFDDQSKLNAMPLLFRLVEVNNEGDITRGDTSPWEASELNDTAQLPPWFTDKLMSIN